MNEAMRAYYERRAPHYDDWWHGTGQFAGRDRPGWETEVAGLTAALRALPPARTLDVGCGTGFLTAHLPGDTARREDAPAEAWQERELDDGSRHRVYKRWFTPAGLQAELGGGSVLFGGDWFVAVRRC